MKQLFEKEIPELRNLKNLEIKPFFDNAYHVSNYGHIIRYGKFKSGYNIKNPRILKTSLSTGYEIFSIRVKNKNITYKVHKIVAEMFLGKMPPDKECINHIDGVKTNNKAENLEYVTHAENRIHAIKTGLSSSAPNKKVTKNLIEKIKNEFIPTRRSNAIELSNKYNLSVSTIVRIANEK